MTDPPDYDRLMEAFVERELKLEPPDGFELPPLEGEQLESRVFTSTYYDTPPRSLARAGITLRRRVENGYSRWQLKLPRGGNARAELEAPGGPAGPPPELRPLLAAHLRHGEIEPVATLRTRRAGVRVADHGRRVADVTLDVVHVMDAGRTTGEFVELEIELVDGDEADLERLGRTLRRAGARRSDGRPKLMRVLDVPKDEKPGRHAPALERLRHLLATQLRELEAHDPGVRTGDDPEDLHQFRVATRRTRALIRATKPLLGETLAPLGAELKWLAGILGPVRDLDVLLEHLREEAGTLGEDRKSAELIVAALEEERATKRDELLSALDSARYTTLLDSFADAITSLPDLDAPNGLHPVALHTFRKLRKAAAALDAEPADDELHALRIRAKRARYAAELAGGKKLESYVDSLKHVQDVIGEHQDAVVAEQRIRGAARAKTAVAAGRLIERERDRRLARRRAYGGAVDDALRRGRKALG